MKSSWKGSEIYHISRSGTLNFICWSIMVPDIFEEFELPAEKFLVIVPDFIS